MIKRFLTNALALGLATWLLSGITLGSGTTGNKIATIAVVAVIFGVLNALVRPVLKFFSMPLIILSLGLFIWIINAAMLMLTSTLATNAGWAWHVDGWVPALVGAAIVTLVGGLAGHALDREHQ